MPKVSRESASNVRELPVAEDRAEELDGYSVCFVTIRQTQHRAGVTRRLVGLPVETRTRPITSGLTPRQHKEEPCLRRKCLGCPRVCCRRHR
jgi:hypothetical protein